jgi:hypothetical protein
MIKVYIELIISLPYAILASCFVLTSDPPSPDADKRVSVLDIILTAVIPGLPVGCVLFVEAI